MHTEIPLSPFTQRVNKIYSYVLKQIQLKINANGGTGAFITEKDIAKWMEGPEQN